VSLADLANTALDDVTVIGFKDAQAGVEQFALGNDHHVEPRRDLVTTENLSYQSFRAISLDRTTDLASGRDTQPAYPDHVRQHEHRDVPAVKPDAMVVDPLKLRPATDPFSRAEFQRRTTRY
jgi:hypothetical protein